MPEIEIVPTIDAVPANAWDALSFDGIERHAYLRAVEQAGLHGFEWRYVLVRDGGELLAAAPAFVTDYAIDTTLGAEHARLAATLRRLLPRLMRPRMAALGSPCTETLPLGFAIGADVAARREAASLIADGLDRLAAREGAALAGVKDVAAADALLMASVMGARGYSRMPSLPIASLPIAFDTIDAYLAGLSPGTRRDMRRKLRSRSEVRIERVRDIAPVLDRVMALYRDTLARAELTFEELTGAFFTGVLREMGDRAFMTLYWQGDDLIAANLLLEEDGLLLDKFFCMEAARGRALNLYYLSWFDNLDYCLAHHLVRYQAGQAAYHEKRRLGCRMEPTAIWFRHRNGLMNRILAMAAPHLAPADAIEDAA